MRDVNIGANARQVAGEHYRASKYQHWDLAVDLRLGYFEGQVSKYVSRAARKNGLQDLHKGEHFLEKMMEAVQFHGYQPIHVMDEARGRELATLHSASAQHDPVTTVLIGRIVTWTRLEHLHNCQHLISTLIRLAEDGSGEATGRYVGQ